MDYHTIIKTILCGLKGLSDYCEDKLSSQPTSPELTNKGEILTAQEFSEKHLFCNKGAVYDILKDRPLYKKEKNGKLAAYEKDLIRLFLVEKRKRLYPVMKRHYNLITDFKKIVDEVVAEAHLKNPFHA